MIKSSYQQQQKLYSCCMKHNHIAVTTAHGNFRPVVLEVRKYIGENVWQQWNDAFLLLAAVDDVQQCDGDFSEQQQRLYTVLAMNSADSCWSLQLCCRLHYSQPSQARHWRLDWWLGPFHGAIAVPSVTRCRCHRRWRRGHRCAGGVRQYSGDTWWIGMRRLIVANGPNSFQMLLVHSVTVLRPTQFYRRSSQPISCD